ncbi:OmpH family outer membrane protein [Natronoflexus pectinivorans]|nr:OmpH family outer membrane protein [Natronoflexus pectinivorans]
MAENMKKISVIVNVVLLVAVAALYVVVLSNGRTHSEEEKKPGMRETSDHGIVYINTDSLIINYEFARKLSEDLLRREESSRTDFNSRARVFQEDMMEFQRKLQNNGFLSLERAQNEERRLRQKEVELQELNTRLSNELMRHQDQMNQQLRDTITNFLSEFSEKRSYRMVISNTMGDNILYAEPVYDITKDVVEMLNKRYRAAGN